MYQSPPGRAWLSKLAERQTTSHVAWSDLQAGVVRNHAIKKNEGQLQSDIEMYIQMSFRDTCKDRKAEPCNTCQEKFKFTLRVNLSV